MNHDDSTANSIKARDDVGPEASTPPLPLPERVVGHFFADVLNSFFSGVFSDDQLEPGIEYSSGIPVGGFHAMVTNNRGWMDQGLGLFQIE